MKRLVVCCDGTWNDADSTEDFTNVARMGRAVQPVDGRQAASVSQIVYYQSGVGSEGDVASRVVAGGVGLGLSRNVRDAYAFLANNYCDGDELFLFGFSRGAYTARSIAGLIGWAGILHKRDMDDFALLWEGYRLRSNPGEPDTRLSFPDRHDGVGIKVVGVWDTVGALGIPGHFDRLFTQFYQFLDTDLGVHVENAFHALALDEHRADFAPTLWTRKPDAPSAQTLIQTWFAGAHSNVGGGYAEHGLSDVAFAWMASRVDHLLALDWDYIKARQDRRNAWAEGKLYKSATGLFGLLPTITRKVSPGLDGQAIHASVMARSGASLTPPYVPDNLPLSVQTEAMTALEQDAHWPVADPTHDGQSYRPKPTFIGSVLSDLGGS